MQLTVSLFLALSITQSCSFSSAGSTGCFRAVSISAVDSDLSKYLVPRSGDKEITRQWQ
jgi:hypothetical protein